MNIPISKVVFRGVCPVCGDGKLYAKLLDVCDKCAACGAELGKHDAADGPAFFVMFIVSILVFFMAMVLEVVATPPLWLHMVVWMPVTIGLSVYLLRIFKAWMIALECRHNTQKDKDPNHDHQPTEQ